VGKTPRTVEWAGECGSPTAFVLSKNLSRRHLTATQLALLALELEPLFAEEAKERQREHGGTAPGRPTETLPQLVGEVSATDPHEAEAAAQAAAATGVNRDYVRIAKNLKAKEPELFAAVERGEMSLKTADRHEREKRGHVPVKRGPRVTEAQMRPPQPTREQLLRYGLEGLAQHAHDFHGIVLRTQDQILSATKTWNLASRARLLAEIRDMLEYLPRWEAALAERDEAAS
jgi:hypothetical protein